MMMVYYIKATRGLGFNEKVIFNFVTQFTYGKMTRWTYMCNETN